LAALLHGTVVVRVSQLCGVEQRAQPIFGRAAITLGIGTHSSSLNIQFIMAALCNYRAGHYIFALWFLLLSSLWPPCVADADIIFSSCGFFIIIIIIIIYLP